MIIGGGALIRFDKQVAPRYFPPTPYVHHPTGYWLTPALICLHAGCPVAWGAPGNEGAVPAWAEPLMRLAIGLSGYVAVRDEDARKTLVPFAGELDIAVVPDTCFGLPRLLPDDPSPALSSLCRSLQLDRPYIVVQATRHLEAFARLVARHRARFAGFRFLALPIGPALGDDATILGDAFPNLVKLPYYPDPLLMAELIAGAAAAVGVSLHFAITATAFGVPTFRPDVRSAENTRCCPGTRTSIPLRRTRRSTRPGSKPNWRSAVRGAKWPRSRPGSTATGTRSLCVFRLADKCHRAAAAFCGNSCRRCSRRPIVLPSAMRRSSSATLCLKRGINKSTSLKMPSRNTMSI
jgi:hypothetical protein